MALTYCKDLHLALSLRLAVNAFVQLNAAKLHIEHGMLYHTLQLQHKA